MHWISGIHGQKPFFNSIDPICNGQLARLQNTHIPQSIGEVVAAAHINRCVRNAVSGDDVHRKRSLDVISGLLDSSTSRCSPQTNKGGDQSPPRLVC